MPRQPYMQFYTGDWKRSADVQSLPYSERGVWFEILCLMHDSPQRGALCHSDGTPLGDDEVARLLGLSRQEFANALGVLLRSKVTERNENGALINRRMVRERLAMEAKQRAGKAGAEARWHTKAMADPMAEVWHASDTEICLWQRSSESDQKKIREAWTEWQAYRERRAEAPKDWYRMWRKQLEMLWRFPIPVAIEMINASIRNNWIGLFEPKNGAPSHHRPAPATHHATTRLKVKDL